MSVHVQVEARNANQHVLILSGDKDFLQLARPGIVELWNHSGTQHLLQNECCDDGAAYLRKRAVCGKLSNGFAPLDLINAQSFKNTAPWNDEQQLKQLLLEQGKPSLLQDYYANLQCFTVLQDRHQGLGLMPDDLHHAMHAEVGRVCRAIFEETCSHVGSDANRAVLTDAEYWDTLFAQAKVVPARRKK